MGEDPENNKVAQAEGAGYEHEDEAYETANTKNPALDPAKRNRAQGRWAFTRRGWFWGAVIAVIAVSVVTPIAVKVQRRMKTVPLPADHRDGPYDARSLDTRAASAVESLAPPPTCAQLAGDLPLNGTLVGGRPPPPLRFEGGRLVSVGTGGRAQLRGVTLDGFEAGNRAFVALPGLLLPPPAPSSTEGRPAAVAAWASSDLLTALAALRLQGFNAVRLPFSFEALARAPKDEGGGPARPCPGKPPSVAELAALASAAPPPPAALELPKAAGNNSSSNSSSGGVCNEHIPASSALARLLWVVEACVRSGMYVVLERRPPQAQQQQQQQQQDSRSNYDDPAALAGAWQRLGAALMCLPAWQGGSGGSGGGAVMAGRVLLDPAGVPPIPAAAEPPASQGGRAATANLAAAQLAALDALARLPPAVAAGPQKQPNASSLDTGKLDNGLLFALQGISLANSTGRDSTADGTLPPLLEVLVARPYAGRVLLAPRLAGPSGGSSGRAPVSPSFAAEWTKLRSGTFCSNQSSISDGGKPTCVRFPVAAGELSAALDGGSGDAWANSTAALLAGSGGGSGGRKLEPADGWWWAPYACDGGLVSADRSAAPQWRQLRWLRDRAGLKPLVAA